MIFVTGSTGLVGAHVTIELLRKGYSVKALLRPGSSVAYFEKLSRFYNIGYDPGQFRWTEGEIDDVPFLADAMEGCHTVYNCAGFVSFEGHDWDRLLSVNRKGTANVVNAALEASVKKICHVSSVAALDMSKGIKGKKTDWKVFRREQPYGYSKYLGELEVWRGMEEGLDVVVVHPGVVIGPAAPANPLSRMMENISRIRGYYPPGSTGYIGAVDLARAMVELTEAQHSGNAYTLVSSHHSFKEVLEAFSKALGTLPPHRPMPGSFFGVMKIIAYAGRVINRRIWGIGAGTIKSMKKVSFYDVDDVKGAISFGFRPIQDDVNDTVAFSKL